MFFFFFSQISWRSHAIPHIYFFPFTLRHEVFFSTVVIFSTVFEALYTCFSLFPSPRFPRTDWVISSAFTALPTYSAGSSKRQYVPSASTGAMQHTEGLGLSGYAQQFHRSHSTGLIDAPPTIVLSCWPVVSTALSKTSGARGRAPTAKACLEPCGMAPATGEHGDTYRR